MAAAKAVVAADARASVKAGVVANARVAARAVAAGTRRCAAYAKGVLGEDAYEKYLAYHRSAPCGAPPMTVKEFWRDKTDREGANPQGRCC